jgi:hypothetical protein
MLYKGIFDSALFGPKSIKFGENSAELVVVLKFKSREEVMPQDLVGHLILAETFLKRLLHALFIHNSITNWI